MARPARERLWYDQKNPEWVMLVCGEALLRSDPGGDVALKSGDILLISANTRHRVKSVSAMRSGWPCILPPEAPDEIGRLPPYHSVEEK